MKRQHEELFVHESERAEVLALRDNCNWMAEQIADLLELVETLLEMQATQRHRLSTIA